MLLGLDDFKEGASTGTGGAGGIGGVNSSSSSSGVETGTSGSAGGGGSSSATTATSTTATGEMSSSSSGAGGEATSSSAGSSSSGGCVAGDMMACYTGPPATKGKGKCMDGTATCQNGIYDACSGQQLPAPEACDVIGDENCDGVSCSDAVWSKLFGDTNYHEFYGTAIDSQGNILVAGVFTGSLKFDALPSLVSSGQDYFLLKLNGGGTPLWAKQFGDATDNGAFIHVAVDQIGAPIIAGGLKGSADFGGGTVTAASGSTDIFVVKFDAAGVYKWGKLFGASTNEWASALAVDSSGDVIIGGGFPGTVTFGGATFTATGGPYDAFLAKLGSASGAHIWSKQFTEASGQGASSQSINSVAVDPANAVIVGGFFSKSANFGGGSLLATTAAVVAKFDKTGNFGWAKAFAPTSQIANTNISTDSNGNVLIASNLVGSIDFGGGNISAQGPNSNICVAKLDSAGAHQWSKVFADGSSDWVAGVATDSNNNVTFTGYMAGTPNFGGGILSNAGGYDAFLAKLDSTGAHLWSKSFGDVANQTGSTVATDPATMDIVMGAVALGTINFGAATSTLMPPAGSTWGGATLAKFQP